MHNGKQKITVQNTTKMADEDFKYGVRGNVFVERLV
jgi:hypothetical protein